MKRSLLAGSLFLSFFLFCGLFDPDPGLFKYEPTANKTIKNSNLEVSFVKFTKTTAATLTDFKMEYFNDDIWKHNNVWVMTIKNISKEKLRVEPFKDAFMKNQNGQQTNATSKIESSGNLNRVGGFAGIGLATQLIGAGDLQSINNSIFYFRDLEPGQSYTGIVIFERFDSETESITAYFPNLDESNGFGKDSQKTLFQWNFKLKKIADHLE